MVEGAGREAGETARKKMSEGQPRVEFHERGADEDVVMGKKIAFGDGTVGVVVEVNPTEYGVVKVTAADILAAQPMAQAIKEVNEQLASERGELRYGGTD